MSRPEPAVADASSARRGWPAARAVAYALIAFAVVGSGLGAAIGGSALNVVSFAILVAAVATVAVALTKNRPTPRAAWCWLAVGLTLWGIGNLTWVAVVGSTTKITVADVICLAAFVPLTVGQILIGRGRGVEHTRDGLIDGSILALVGILLAWVAVIAPEVYGTTMVERIVIALYPLLDALLLIGVIWIALLPGKRSTSLILLGSGYAVALVADVWWYVGLRFDTMWTGRLDGLYPIALALMAAAVIHPSSRDVARRPATVDHDRVHTGRLVVLATAMFAGPIAAMAADGEFGVRDIVVTLCCLVVVGLVIARFFELVQENERSRLRFRLLAENVPSGVYEIGPDFQIRYANAEAIRHFGRPLQDVGASELLSMVDSSDRDKVAVAAQRLLDGDPVEVEFRLHAADGVARWISLRGSWEQRGRANATILGSTVDISPLKEAELVLERQATHDPLTGLPNRRLLADRLASALSRQRRHPGTLAVLFCDLDGFKTVNDVYGHDTGDLVLVQIAHRIAAMLRGSDTVARIGGDEFVLVCDDTGSHDDVGKLATKLIATVNEPIDTGDEIVSVGVSVGIVMASTGDDGSALLRTADSAMYRAKAEGRNRFTIAEAELPEVAGLHRVGEADR
jgi:diguanylate cyclase (GGDEF)-like protein/PAS domain S-box-containing protein